jgi:hypothetical protein
MKGSVDRPAFETTNRRRWPSLGVLLVFTLAFCAACDSRTPSQRIWFPSPPTSPTPPPPAVPMGPPHLVEIMYDPDMWNSPAPRDADGSYVLDWAAGWYCVWLSNVPDTTPDSCREYRFTFSWPPELSSGATWSRGCQKYPNTTNPGTCFQSPSRDSVSARQSITIVGLERLENKSETEMFNMVVPIRFKDR